MGRWGQSTAEKCNQDLSAQGQALARLKEMMVCLVVVELWLQLRVKVRLVTRVEVIFTVQLQDRSRCPIEFWSVHPAPKSDLQT